MNHQKSPQLKSSNSRSYKWVLLGILVIIAAFVVVVLDVRTHKKNSVVNKPNTVVSAGQATKGQPTNSSNTSPSTTPPGGSSSDNTKNPGNPNSTSPNTPLTAPQGNFVSNHHPNLGGTPTPNTETSVCNTTVGASCEIIFTKAGVTKSLPAQTTDAGGATYWNGWKLQDIGLTEGTWQVSAKAILGNQIKTTQDVIPFEVSQ